MQSHSRIFPQWFLKSFVSSFVPLHISFCALRLINFLLDKRLFMGDEGERRLRHLGRLMAFDLAVNNFDRLPLVWGNKGNFGNIMVSKDEKRQMIGIDFGVNPIKKTIRFSSICHHQHFPSFLTLSFFSQKWETK